MVATSCELIDIPEEGDGKHPTGFTEPAEVVGNPCQSECDDKYLRSLSSAATGAKWRSSCLIVSGRPIVRNSGKQRFYIGKLQSFYPSISEVSYLRPDFEL